METYLEIWRFGNAALATIALLLMLRQILRMWGRWAQRMRLLAMALSALLFAVAYGSVEVAFEHVPYGNRLWMTTAACIWVIYAEAFTPAGYVVHKDSSSPRNETTV